MPKYEEQFNCKLIPAGGDTDSIFIRADNVDVYKVLIPEMIKDKLLDTSNYPESHERYSDDLNARLGCVKDELKGKIRYVKKL